MWTRRGWRPLLASLLAVPMLVAVAGGPAAADPAGPADGTGYPAGRAPAERAAGRAPEGVVEQAPDEASARERARRTGRRVEVTGLRTDTREVYANPSGTMLLRAYARPVRSVATAATNLYYPSVKSAWGYVEQSYSGTPFYNNKEVARVGYFNDRSIGESDTFRSMFRMDIAPVTGGQIFSATFSAYETYSWSCEERGVELWEIGVFGSGTTWKKQPTWLRNLETRNEAKGRSGCPAGPVEFNAMAAVADAAAAGQPTVNLGLKATDEKDSYGWKKFQNNPTLTIEYNSIPDVPTALRVAPSYVCAASADAAPAQSDTTPTLTAALSDRDSAQQIVSAGFELSRDGATIWTYQTPAKQAGGVAVTTPALVDGATYAFRVRADDGIAQGPWSDWCYFRVDVTAPNLVPVVTSSAYPEADPANPVRSGGVGKPGSFTFSAGGIADIAGYRYDVDNPQPTSTVTAAADGTATVSVTPGPSRSTLRTLYVRSVDAAGNLSAVRAYDFYVNLAAGPAGYWRMDEASGTTVADASGGGRALTVTGGTRTAGRLGTGADPGETAYTDRTLTLSGSGQYAATGGPVVRTDTSFSVSAWVRLKTNTANATVLTQPGTTNGGFQLYYSTAYANWVFNRHATDAADPPIIRAVSGVPFQLNRWTQLTGVYDLSARQLRLYVNGALAATNTYDQAAWNATGPLQIGRLKYNGAFTEYLPGDVDEVRVYDRVLYPDEIAENANRPASQFGKWLMDEATGTTVKDATGRNHPLTAAGGVTWGTDRFGVAANAVVTNGTTGYLATTAGTVETDRSFTVAAWVNQSATTTGWSTMVSQDGSRHSGFFLQYSPTDRRWAFSMLDRDAAGAVPTRVYSRGQAVLGRWTHLVGVYDAAARQIRLYVDGELATASAFTGTWSAGGPLQVGRAKYDGAYSDYWPGAIDDVRVYSGVLTQSEIDDLALS